MPWPAELGGRDHFAAPEMFAVVAESGAMPNISTGRLENLEIEVPPLSHERVFAKRISAVERLKVAKRAT